MDLQPRQFAFFALLFQASIVFLSLFLFNSLRMLVRLNHGREIFEQNRQIYQLRALRRQNELDLNNHELNVSDLAWMQLEAQNALIEKVMNALQKRSDDLRREAVEIRASIHKQMPVARLSKILSARLLSNKG